MLRVFVLAVIGIALSWLLYLATFESPPKISPQGCRMSYMWPSYILQTGLDGSWTRLAGRYSLWLYREANLEPEGELHGLPVLFIPGNAGSSRQVRSIASSAARQYYSSPSIPFPYFEEKGFKSLDFFAVDFNEDLSAFHGPTLEAQRTYVVATIRYILSQYPPSTKFIIMGHSMGGIVGTSLLPSEEISAIITMSTPHSVPPARFDSRMDDIYLTAQNQVEKDLTPILSICGGITDTMIPSEFCILPNSIAPSRSSGYRRTVFSSAMEGCWTGVGHREMVWCHQVRWRVARAALELANSASSNEIGQIFDTWFQDGPNPVQQSPAQTLRLDEGMFETLPNNMPLVLKQPSGSRVYTLPVPESPEDNSQIHLTFYMSGGALPPISPANPGPMTARLYACSSLQDGISCQTLALEELKLLPNPDRDKLFPLPSEGVDESEGVVAAVVNAKALHDAKWVAVKIENADGRGWAIGRFENGSPIVDSSPRLTPFVSTTTLSLEPAALHSKIQIPSWLASTLLVYKLEPELSASCEGALLPPMLWHVAGTSESHYYRIEHKKTIYLHTHSSAPFLPLHGHPIDSLSNGISLTIHSSGECGVSKLDISIDWWNSFGRWGARYWNAVLAWGAGIIGLAFGWSLWKWDSGASMTAPGQTLNSYVGQLPKAMVLATIIALLPLPSSMLLGNAGEIVFSPIAGFILFLSSGLVCLTWVILSFCSSVYGKIANIFSRPAKETPISHKRGAISMLVISALVFLVVPWQVAFLACYMLHFHACATAAVKPGSSPSSPRSPSPGSEQEQHRQEQDAHAQRLHVLLLMTWCLPILAPVLAVWVRTLLTAGFTTPFDGDHFVMNVIAFMYLTYSMSGGGPVLLHNKHRFEYIPVPYLYALGSAVTFVLGPRAMYRTYEAINWPTIALVCFRALPKLRS
ncbi:PGAP1-domain-containing protein [Schizopora paradoxa]|uniref:GPI inositol-deacylase n=1 Tax=Schizopora paradoxa TaxID=27342 RepID=A0A0H2S741_9AGAM|nr:PGAP1-domain-containing protein [Schizopora paradoxa]